MMLFVVSTL